jgi:uncharacterized protein (TIGR00369 family)
MSNENRGAVERVFREAEFVRSLGIELAAHGAGWCETRVKIRPALRQQHGFAHAGVLMTLADHTCGGAASTVAEDRDVITVENTISFLRPAASAELFCRATVLRAGKNLVFVEAEVMVEGDAGRVLVAKMSSTLAVIALKAKPAEKLANSS